MHRRNRVRTLLTIAGSDNLGGAGIQADVKTSCAFRVYASTVITAVTAQCPGHVERIETIAPDLVAAQIDTIYKCMTPDAIKIGMLPNAETVAVVASKLEEVHANSIVLDPVLMASSGDSLTGDTEDTLRAMKEFLFPLATLITPNLPEAYRIIGEKSDSIEDLSKKLWSATRASAVLIKGGHSEGIYSTDILYNGNEFSLYRQSRIESPNTHGTGCVLSTAIACGLAKDMTLPKSVRMAKDFITHAIRNAVDTDVCRGRGPLYLFKS